MAYNSTLPTTKIEGALLASLKTKKIEYNITQDKSSNYASLAEAIAAVDDDEYKVKGIVLTFYTGTDWVSKRYNGEDASGFADEGNWIDVGGAAGGTKYLDLSMFSEESGTLSEEDYQKVVKAYEDGVATMKYGTTFFNAGFVYSEDKYELVYNDFTNDYGKIYFSSFKIVINSDKTYTNGISGLINFLITLDTTGSGTKALTDNGQYAEFAKPTKVERGGSGGSHVTKQIKPNTYYKFREVVGLTITFAAEESGIVNEYMFEFVSGSTPTTLSLPDSVKWKDGKEPTMEASKTYQISIVNNLAVYAAF